MLGISFGVPIITSAKQFIGVAFADLYLDSLSLYLAAQGYNGSGVIYIVERTRASDPHFPLNRIPSGRVIATSNGSSTTVGRNESCLSFAS